MLSAFILYFRLAFARCTGWVALLQNPLR